MKSGALLFMLISWSIIVGVCAFCFARLFANQGQKNKKGSK